MTERGHRGRAHVLLTPANRYASRLAWLPEATVFKLVSPRLRPAAFSQQLLRLDTDPTTPRPLPAGGETFLFAWRGALTVEVGGEREELSTGGHLFLPEGTAAAIVGARDAEVVRVHRPWTPLDGVTPPTVRRGHLDDEPPAPTAVPGLARRELLPGDDPAFDFTMSVMRFDPGAELGMVEIHDEEHGLLMLEGGGRYLLDDGWHDVLADDFVYLAPYCPQGFVAGPEGATYLLYKDTWRESP